MKYLFGALGWFVLMAVLTLGGTAMADPVVPPEVLAQKPSDTIPLGTRITPANWKQYSEFMPYGLQALISGKYGLPCAIAPNEGITIGPTTTLPLPKAYLADTEKFGGQAQLVAAPQFGGYNIQNYTAGMPFPNPTEPMKGLKIMYDTYYHYAPALVTSNPAGGARVDRYGNVTYSENLVIFNKTKYLSDPTYPDQQTRPRPGPYWLVEYAEVTAPEQSRYSAFIDLWPDDAGGTFEYYTFVPSLRRSLRLSSNARCAPSSGSDTFVDDNNGGTFVQWPMFDVKYIGEAKILVLANVNEDLNHTLVNLPPQAKVFDFQHANWQRDDSWGKWELHDVIITSATRFPNSPGFGSYCYGPRTSYIDKTWYTPWEVDLQDKEGHFWKCKPHMRAIQTTAWGERIWEDSGNDLDTMYDFQLRHYSAQVNPNGDVDSQIPNNLHDMTRYGSPAGLEQIAQ